MVRVSYDDVSDIIRVDIETMKRKIRPLIVTEKVTRLGGVHKKPNIYEDPSAVIAFQEPDEVGESDAIA
jgi:hypothetical protein